MIMCCSYLIISLEDFSTARHTQMGVFLTAAAKHSGFGVAPLMIHFYNANFKLWQKKEKSQVALMLS